MGFKTKSWENKLEGVQILESELWALRLKILLESPTLGVLIFIIVQA